MSISVDWDNQQQTVVRWHFVGSYTWDELSAALQTSSALIRSVPYIVDVIIDLRSGSGLPENAFGLTRSYLRSSPSNTGLLIVVGGNLLVRSFIQMYQKLSSHSRQQFVLAPTVEQAYTLFLKQPLSE